MKLSLIASAALAVVILLIGWRNQSRIGSIRETQAKLTADAARLGLSTDLPEGSTPSSSRRDRPNREAAAKATASELIDFAKEIEVLEKSGRKPEEMEKFQERILEFMDRMASLDSVQLKSLITEFRDSPGLSKETRQGLIAFSVMTLANNHPKAALELFTETSDLLPDQNMSQQLLSSSLGGWAEEDPHGALTWVRANLEKFPDLINERAKSGLIAGIAASDPKLAFKLMKELEVGLSGNGYRNSVNSIVQAAQTSAQRTATLEAFREHLGTMNAEDEKNQAITGAFQSFASQLTQEGFVSATTWVTSNNLSPAELEGFAQGINHAAKGAEKGQWLQWIGDTLPPQSAGKNVSAMVRQWTREDYQAAGQWLVSAPDGPAKQSAVESYADTVAPYEPDTATQWALTLPPGKSRDATLKKIHQHLLNKDPAAGAAFAEKHGIK